MADILTFHFHRRSNRTGLAELARRLQTRERYLLTIPTVAFATVLKLAFAYVSGQQLPFITYYPAVLLMGIIGGIGPGLLTLAMSCLSVLLLMKFGQYLNFQETSSYFSLIFFSVMNVFMLYFAEQLRKALRSSESTAVQLLRSQEQMRLLIESAKDYAIFSMDARGRIDLWGAGAERIFGYSENDILGCDGKILFTPEDIREKAPEKELQRAIIAGRAEDERWHVRQNGSRFFASGVVRPVRDSTGSLVGFIKIARDMTDRRRSEEELQHYRERLEDLVAERTEALRQSLDQLRRAERLASIGTLAAGVAHEINNPLNSILLTADYARRFPGDVEAKSVYETVISEAKRCGRIVRGILKFAKEQKTPKEPGDLNETIVRVASMRTQYFPSEGLWLDMDLAETLPVVSINPTEIEQLVVNLVQNAIEASDGEVRVVIRTLAADDHIMLTVEDNGPGMTPEVLQQIFDPFFSTRQHRGGTGLGLSICHGIVTDHGGIITAQSRPGEGTKFFIRLPIAAPDTAAPAA